VGRQTTPGIKHHFQCRQRKRHTNTTWAKPIPNAFSVDAEAKNPGATAETAMSWVLSNPSHPYKLAAPHSFLHIKVDEMKCHWYFYPVPPFKVEFGAAQTYDFNDSPKSMTGTPMPAGGVLCSYGHTTSTSDWL
jgi:hypothetical protein